MMDLKRLRRLERLKKQAAKAKAPVVAAAPEPVIEAAPEPEPAVIPEPVEEPEPVAVAEEEESAPEWSMANTKSALIEAAEEAGVEIKSNWTKAQILEALNA
jgi:hypothetical protein